MAVNNGNSPEVDQLNRFNELEQSVDVSRRAFLGAFAILETMINDSNEIADSILPTISSPNSVRQLWPLTSLDSMYARSIYRSAGRLSILEPTDATLDGQQLQHDPMLFWTDYADADITALYSVGDASYSRACLIADLEIWAQEMAKKGWPVIFSAEMTFPERTSVWVNEDTPETRQTQPEFVKKGRRKIDEDIKIERSYASYIRHKIMGGLLGNGQTSIETRYGFVNYIDRKTAKHIRRILASRSAES